MSEKLPQRGIGYKEYLYYNNDGELEGVIALYSYKDPIINQAAIGLIRSSANILATLYEDPNRPGNKKGSRRKKKTGAKSPDDK